MNPQNPGSERTGTLPWTRSCFVCGESNPDGLRLRSRVEDGRVCLVYRTRPTDVGYSDLVHGGILATLLDEAMTWAAILSSRRVCVAAEFTTRLKRPVRSKQTIRVEGVVQRPGSRLVGTAGVILDGQGDELVTATGKYVPMPRELVEACEKDFVDSPDALDLDGLFASTG